MASAHPYTGENLIGKKGTNMGNPLRDMDGGDRYIGFLKLEKGKDYTVDIDPEFEPVPVKKHRGKTVINCTGRDCEHCAIGHVPESYWRIKVLEYVTAGKIEQYIDLSPHNWDQYRQIVYPIEDIAASNPFTFVCRRYEAGRSFHIKGSHFANPHFVTFETIAADMGLESEAEPSGDESSDDDFEFDFGE
jgi:hypothetical protein